MIDSGMSVDAGRLISGMSADADRHGLYFSNINA